MVIESYRDSFPKTKEKIAKDQMKKSLSTVKLMKTT